MKKIFQVIGVVLLVLVGYVLFINRLKTITVNKDYPSNKIDHITITTGRGNISVSGSKNDSTNLGIKYKGAKPEIITMPSLGVSASKFRDANLEIPPNLQGSLSISTGASNLEIEVGTSKINNFNLHVGAGNLKILLPYTINSNFKLSLGAGNIELARLEGTGIKFVPAEGTELGDEICGEYEKVEQSCQSANFETANIKTTITISAGTVNLKMYNVKPEQLPQ